VWQPQQWTPIHDHGTWGVVGVVEGVLQESAYMRTDSGNADALTDIELARGGLVMLAQARLPVLCRSRIIFTAPAMRRTQTSFHYIFTATPWPVFIFTTNTRARGASRKSPTSKRTHEAPVRPWRGCH